ncbi:MAG: nucleotidyltransferase family protein [Chthonomonadales bacterium]
MTGHLVERVPAVVLAGGKTLEPAARRSGVSHRALIRVAGEPMVHRVVEALAAASHVSTVVVIGDLPADRRYRLLPDAGSLVENVYAGLREVGDSSYALVATCDIPFLTSEAVDDFIRKAAATQADFVYPVVNMRLCRQRFPAIRRTSVLLREGEFTGGNMVLVNTRVMASQRERIQVAYNLRKSPARLAMVLGFGTVALFALTVLLRRGFLSIPRLEEAVSRMMGCTARAVVVPHAEIATDIDTEEDLAAIGASP